MPKPTFLNLPDDKRDRIVDLAIEEFSTRSFHEASLSNLVRRAGIAKGSIYQYFDDKLDLYRWLVTEEVGRRKRAWIAAHPPAPGAGVFATLEQALVVGVGFYAAHPRLARLAAHLLRPPAEPGLLDLHVQARVAGVAWLGDLLRQGQITGEIRDDLDVPLAAEILARLLGEALPEAVLARLGIDLLRFLEAPQPVDEAALREGVHAALDMLLGGLGARPLVVAQGGAR